MNSISSCCSASISEVDDKYIGRCNDCKEMAGAIPQCELCDYEWFDQENLNLIEDYESIEQNGRCVACYEEWSDGWPDR
jgi:hypothetical protein